jgi:hypothetical protein
VSGTVRESGGGWWRGTRLVVERSLVEQLRSRSFRIVTALLLLVSLAAVTIPQRSWAPCSRWGW